MSDIHELLASIEASLYTISKRELQVSDKMRSLADESDILSEELTRLGTLLTKLPLDSTAISVQSEIHHSDSAPYTEPAAMSET